MLKKNLSFDSIFKRVSDKKPKLEIYKLSEYVGKVNFDKNLFVRWEGPKVSRSEWDLTTVLMASADIGYLVIVVLIFYFYPKIH